MATTRILVIGNQAVKLSQDLGMARIQSFWLVRSSSVSNAMQILKEGSVDAVIISEFVEGEAASGIAASIRDAGSSPPIFILGDESTSSRSLHYSGATQSIPASMDNELFTHLIEVNARCHRLQHDNGQLNRSIDKARKEKLSKLNLAPARRPENSSSSPELVGTSVAIRDIRHKIQEVAATDMSVMIFGETGTGKDIVARAIYNASKKSGEYVKICCPALPEQLLESELFGHEAGAFTGATQKKPGRLEMANNGSVFLDEITEMSPYIQAKLLEVLESKTFMRVGSTKPIEAKLSFYAASNVPLSELFDSKGFRRDLYYRLNQYCIEIPPLRERKEDIPELVPHFLRKFNRIFGRSDLGVSSEFMSRMMEHDWLGNVRELETVVRHYALTQDERIMIHEGDSDTVSVKPKTEKPTWHYRDNERQLICDALNRTKWNRREAAKMLGMSYNTLRRRISKYELV